jgi:hypothetical protein
MAQPAKKTNRKARRTVAAKARSKKTAAASNGAIPALSAQQKKMLAKVNAEAVQVERRIAQLEFEKQEMLGFLSQKRAELRTLCENALRGHGIDLDSPDAGRWRIDVDTMEVEHIAPVALPE